MTTPDMVRVYVQQLCKEIGVTEESVFNAQTNAWYFKKGSVTVEVFLKSYQTVQNTTRTFLRVFSPIFQLPTDPQKQLDVAKGALEANSIYMGVKLGTIADKGWLFAIAERDIEGMDYEEFRTTVMDLASWADQLDDFLQQNSTLLYGLRFNQK